MSNIAEKGNYQYIYISTSIELIFYFFKLHEIINKHVLAINVCYYSFCNEILMIFLSKVQTFFKRYFTRSKPTLSTDTPCPKAERFVTTANVTPKTTNSNSVLPNTASNDIQQHVNSANSGDVDIRTTLSYSHGHFFPFCIELNILASGTMTSGSQLSESE
jgi:hypothetical protein